MENKELTSVLKDSAYVVKQHIGLCRGVEQELPLKVYENILKAISELEPTLTPVEKENKRVLLEETLNNNNNEQIVENNTKGARLLLLQSGLLVENQIRYANNQPFFDKCDKFIEECGVEHFVHIIERTLKAKTKTKIRNIYSYMSSSMENEKRGLTNA